MKYLKMFLKVLKSLFRITTGNVVIVESPESPKSIVNPTFAKDYTLDNYYSIMGDKKPLTDYIKSQIETKKNLYIGISVMEHKNTYSIFVSISSNSKLNCEKFKESLKSNFELLHFKVWKGWKYLSDFIVVEELTTRTAVEELNKEFKLGGEIQECPSFDGRPHYWDIKFKTRGIRFQIRK